MPRRILRSLPEMNPQASKGFRLADRMPVPRSACFASILSRNAIIASIRPRCTSPSKQNSIGGSPSLQKVLLVTRGVFETSSCHPLLSKAEEPGISRGDLIDAPNVQSSSEKRPNLACQSTLVGNVPHNQDRLLR